MYLPTLADVIKGDVRLVAPLIGVPPEVELAVFSYHWYETESSFTNSPTVACRYRSTFVVPAMVGERMLEGVLPAITPE